MWRIFKGLNDIVREYSDEVYIQTDKATKSVSNENI